MQWQSQQTKSWSAIQTLVNDTEEEEKKGAGAVQEIKDFSLKKKKQELNNQVLNLT